MSSASQSSIQFDGFQFIAQKKLHIQLIMYDTLSIISANKNSYKKKKTSNRNECHCVIENQH